MSERPSPTEPLTNVEASIVRNYERKQRSRLRATLAGYVLTLTTALGMNAYMSDVIENMYNESADGISVASITPDNTDSFALFSNGFYSKNADVLAEKLGPAVQQIMPASLESLHGGDTFRDPNEIARIIIEYAEANEKTSVSLFGYSVGGIETLKAAAPLLKDSKITVDMLYLAATPSSIESLQPDKQLQQDALIKALTLIPYSEHSDYVKFGISMILSKDNYISENGIDTEVFKHNWERLWHEVKAKVQPSVSTLEYQIGLAKSNVREDVHALADNPHAYIPPITYLRIPGDTTVSARAGEDICTYAQEVLIPCTIIDLESETFQTSHERYFTGDSAALYTESLVRHKDTLNEMRLQQAFAHATRLQEILPLELPANAAIE